MQNWRPWAIGIAVAAVVGFLFGLLESATGVELGFIGWFFPVFIGAMTGYILFNLSGNKKARQADAATRDAALRFEPPPAMAALYVYRTGFVASAAGMNIALDGQDMVQLKSPRFARKDIAPGDHILKAAFGGGAGMQSNAGEIAFAAKAGEVILFKLSAQMGAVKNSVKIERKALEEARGDIAKAQMTLTNPPL